MDYLKEFSLLNLSRLKVLWNIFSCRKQLNSDICYNMAKSWKHAKWNKADSKRQKWYDSI